MRTPKVRQRLLKIRPSSQKPITNPPGDVPSCCKTILSECDGFGQGPSESSEQPPAENGRQQSNTGDGIEMHTVFSLPAKPEQYTSGQHPAPGQTGIVALAISRKQRPEPGWARYHSQYPPTRE